MSRIYELHTHAGQIPYADWRANGIEIPVFDKDGTLSDANTLDLVPEVIDGLKKQRITEIFPDIAIASNNHDAAHVREFAGIIENELGVSVFALSRADGHVSKPSPEMGVLIAQHYGVSVDKLGVIGDRRFTDVMFGRNLGAGAIALCEKAGEGDAAGVGFLRILEAAIVGFDKVKKVAVRPVIQT